MTIATDYMAATLVFNLRMLPETLFVGIIILAVLLANQSLVILGIGAGLLQLLTSTVGTLIMKYAPESAVLTTGLDMCSTGFLGRTWNKVLRGQEAPELLWHPIAPSIFMATIGYFYGYGLALLQIYKEEIDAKVVPRSTLIATAIIGTLIVVAAFLSRYWGSCETILGATGGLLFGLAFSYLGAITLAAATDRRATNVWGIPLLKDRINDGSPLYICPADQ